MSPEVIIFYLISAVILTFSLMTILSRRVLRAAVYLLFVLTGTAVYYFMLDYEFLAAVQLAIYAGGIVVLIIFSILLTSQISHRFPHPRGLKLFMGAGAAVLGSLLMITVISRHIFTPARESGKGTDMTTIGTHLMSTQKEGVVLPFEIISILLLAAMIVAIIIAKKEKP